MRYLKDMEDAELVAASDVVAQSVESRCEEFGIGEAFTDYKKMLKSVKPDAVSVCTPNGLHAPCSIAALNAGAHVIVEKPLAMNAREGQKMLDAAKKNRRKLVIGFQYRYDSETTFIKNAVDKGQMGKVLYARVHALRRRGIPNWGVFGRKDLQGGGPMIDIGVHALEMTHFVMGSPKPVAASGSIHLLGRQEIRCGFPVAQLGLQGNTVEDLAVGMIRFDNGATLHLEASFAAHIEKDSNFYDHGRERRRLVGSAGTV